MEATLEPLWPILDWLWQWLAVPASILFLVFWGVGVSQRLGALRQGMVKAFEAVQAQNSVRHGLLMQWSVALLPILGHDTRPLQATQAALLQVQAALEAVRPRPYLPRPMATLKLAEQALAAARQRLLVELPTVLDQAAPGSPGMDIATLQAQLGAADAALQFAHQQFNQTVQTYNLAVHQFPTLIMARLLRHRPAAPI
jgi:LemA protein